MEIVILRKIEFDLGKRNTINLIKFDWKIALHQPVWSRDDQRWSNQLNMSN